MLSRRLQLPQSLTRQRQWQRQTPQSTQWQPPLLHPYILQSRSQSQAKRPPTAKSAAPLAKDPKGDSSSPSPKLYNKLFSPTKKQPKKATKANPKQKILTKFYHGPKRRSRGGVGNTDHARSLDRLNREVPGPFSGNRASLPYILSDFSSWLGDHKVLARGTDQTRKEAKNEPIDDGNVLVLQSASQSLVESDFYRLAGQGRHVDGWVHGITKVIQARSPITQQPHGKYFLFFDKPASAQAYVDEVKKLHLTMREHAPGALSAALATGTTDDQERNDRAENAGGHHPETNVDIPTLLRQYTLLPPDSGLSIRRHTKEKIRDLFSAQQRQQQKELQQPQTPSKDEGTKLTNTTQDALFIDDRVAEYIATLDLPLDQNKVLIKLAGGKLTLYALRWAVNADSRRRNLPWRLLEPSSAIQPLDYSKKTIKYSSFNPPVPDEAHDDYFYRPPSASIPNMTTEEDAIDDTSLTVDHKDHNGCIETQPQKKYPEQSWGDEWASDDSSYRDEWENLGSPDKVDGKQDGFGSFVVSFVDVHEAKRFVREWNRRELWDHRTERWLTVDATWLW